MPMDFTLHSYPQSAERQHSAPSCSRLLYTALYVICVYIAILLLLLLLWALAMHSLPSPAPFLPSVLLFFLPYQFYFFLPSSLPPSLLFSYSPWYRTRGLVWNRSLELLTANSPAHSRLQRTHTEWSEAHKRHRQDAQENRHPPDECTAGTCLIARQLLHFFIFIVSSPFFTWWNTLSVCIITLQQHTCSMLSRVAFLHATAHHLITPSSYHLTISPLITSYHVACGSGGLRSSNCHGRQRSATGCC